MAMQMQASDAWTFNFKKNNEHNYWYLRICRLDEFFKVESMYETPIWRSFAKYFFISENRDLHRT